jgi:hypothetical protein
MVQTRVTLRPGMPCRKMLPVIGLLPKFAEPSVTLLPSELTLAGSWAWFNRASFRVTVRSNSGPTKCGRLAATAVR